MNKPQILIPQFAESAYNLMLIFPEDLTPEDTRKMMEEWSKFDGVLVIKEKNLI